MTRMGEKRNQFPLEFSSNRNHLRSIVYQSYLQTAAPTEKYMFDKSNFKIQSVRPSFAVVLLIEYS